jgi:hypothetical protein
LSDGKKFNFLQNVHEVAHVQKEVTKFNRTVTCDILIVVFIHFKIPACVVKRRRDRQ